jgi:hypothetical protein
MQLTICHPVTSVVWADALFASVLQRSDNPSAGQLRAAARWPEPRPASGAGSAPFTVRTPGPQGRSAGAVEQMQDVFHELHPDGRNAACTVCDVQYRPA